MRILQGVMTAVCALSLGYIQGFADEDNDNEEEKKIYVNPEDIVIKDKTIFVYFESEWLMASSIHTDANGIYVAADERYPLPFQCKKCEKWNSGTRMRCKFCHYPR